LHKKEDKIMIRCEQSIHIAAPSDVVWSILSDPQTWPSWFPEIDQMTGFDPSSGCVLLKRHGTIAKASLHLVDKAQGVLVVNVRQPHEPSASYTFDIDRSGSLFNTDDTQTKLSYMLEYDPPGGFFRNFFATSDSSDVHAVRQTLQQLKQLAEERMMSAVNTP
jgi:carbon monoxide dehydrogenase subunit G